MKLGVFDSGLGGLLIARTIQKQIPGIDMLYYGDTLHLPYGNRSEEAIYAYTERAMRYMFEQGCGLIVIACNTASAGPLRRLQQEWLPKHYPGRNIIGVIVPMLEAAIESGHRRLGLIGTHHTVGSNIYADELRKLDAAISLRAVPTPLLVPLIEYDGMRWVEDVLKTYLAPFREDETECLLLGCTHYALLRDSIRNIMPGLAVLSQDDIVPPKLAAYLHRHPEYKIGRNGDTAFHVSDLTDNYRSAASYLYAEPLPLQKAIL